MMVRPGHQDGTQHRWLSLLEQFMFCAADSSDVLVLGASSLVHSDAICKALGNLQKMKTKWNVGYVLSIL